MQVKQSPGTFYRFLKIDEIKDRQIFYFPRVLLLVLLNLDLNIFEKLLVGNGSNELFQIVLHVKKRGDKLEIVRLFLGEDRQIECDVLSIPADCDITGYLSPKTLFFVRSENPLV